MCFSVPMMFELIPFDCSRMVLLAKSVQIDFAAYLNACSSHIRRMFAGYKLHI